MHRKILVVIRISIFISNSEMNPFTFVWPYVIGPKTIHETASTSLVCGMGTSGFIFTFEQNPTNQMLWVHFRSFYLFKIFQFLLSCAAINFHKCLNYFVSYKGMCCFLSALMWWNPKKDLFCTCSVYRLPRPLYLQAVPWKVST